MLCKMTFQSFANIEKPHCIAVFLDSYNTLLQNLLSTFAKALQSIVSTILYCYKLGSNYPNFVLNSHSKKPPIYINIQLEYHQKTAL